MTSEHIINGLILQLPLCSCWSTPNKGIMHQDSFCQIESLSFLHARNSSLSILESFAKNRIFLFIDQWHLQLVCICLTSLERGKIIRKLFSDLFPKGVKNIQLTLLKSPTCLDFPCCSYYCTITEYIHHEIIQNTNSDHTKCCLVCPQWIYYYS